MDLFSKIQSKYSLKFSNGYPCNIGIGVSGPVQLAINNHTKEQVAVKKICKKVNSSEIQILNKMNHPNIVKYLDSYTSPETSIHFIVMEYLPNGTLFQLINKEGIKNKSQVDSIFQGICRGIQYLHSLGIMHRDIKPQNILLDSNYNPKICDFGCAIKSQVNSTSCGSYQYMAPQILLKRQYSNKIDIWSLGIILFEMIQGRPPYMGNSSEQILQKMAYPIQFSDNFRQSDINVVKKILRANPDHRPDIYQLIGDFEQKCRTQHSAETTLNISSFASKKQKSKTKLISLRESHKTKKNPQIKITNVKFIENKGYIQKLCENANNRLEELCWEKAVQQYHNSIAKKVQQKSHLSKTWSKISLKKSKIQDQQLYLYF